MAASIFARIGTIKGESHDAKHEDEIEVFSWTWGVSQSGAMTPGGGGGRGKSKASFQDLAFTHPVDKASPLLMLACATGERIKEATITVRKADESQQDYIVVKLTDVFVTSVSSSGGDGGTTTESVALAFAKVDLEYTPQKPDGSRDAGVHFKYDLKANKQG
jgi:type VI secretion system secreted protein Hcp